MKKFESIKVHSIVSKETIPGVYHISVGPPIPAGKSIGHEIKLMRKLREMSQVELAEASGLAKSTISRIESGKIQPQSSTLDKIAAGLKCRWRLITD